MQRIICKGSLIFIFIYIFASVRPGFSGAEQRKVVLKWQTVKGATGYVIKIKEKSGISIIEKKTSENFFELSLPYGIYQYRIGALNIVGKVSDWTKWHIININKPEKPGIPKKEEPKEQKKIRQGSQSVIGLGIPFLLPIEKEFRENLHYDFALDLQIYKENLLLWGITPILRMEYFSLSGKDPFFIKFSGYKIDLSLTYFFLFGKSTGFSFSLGPGYSLNQLQIKNEDGEKSDFFHEFSFHSNFKFHWMIQDVIMLFIGVEGLILIDSGDNIPFILPSIGLNYRF